MLKWKDVSPRTFFLSLSNTLKKFGILPNFAFDIKRIQANQLISISLEMIRKTWVFWLFQGQ